MSFSWWRLGTNRGVAFAFPPPAFQLEHEDYSLLPGVLGVEFHLVLEDKVRQTGLLCHHIIKWQLFKARRLGKKGAERLISRRVITANVQQCSTFALRYRTHDLGSTRTLQFCPERSMTLVRVVQYRA